MSGEGQVYKSHKKEYIVIFFVLAFLTVLELIVPGLDTSYFFKASSLVGLAFGKAFIVAWWYMHLNEESTWLKVVAAVPMSAAVYTIVVILESMYR
jgi:heme/copper-type cytochrome/quinol oxidase subunit 4